MSIIYVTALLFMKLQIQLFINQHIEKNAGK